MPKIGTPRGRRAPGENSILRGTNGELLNQPILGGGLNGRPGVEIAAGVAHQEVGGGLALDHRIGNGENPEGELVVEEHLNGLFAIDMIVVVICADGAVVKITAFGGKAVRQRFAVAILHGFNVFLDHDPSLLNRPFRCSAERRCRRRRTG